MVLACRGNRGHVQPTHQHGPVAPTATQVHEVDLPDPCLVHKAGPEVHPAGGELQLGHGHGGLQGHHLGGQSRACNVGPSSTPAELGARGARAEASEELPGSTAAVQGAGLASKTQAGGRVCRSRARKVPSALPTTPLPLPPSSSVRPAPRSGRPPLGVFLHPLGAPRPSLLPLLGSGPPPLFLASPPTSPSGEALPRSPSLPLGSRWRARLARLILPPGLSRTRPSGYPFSVLTCVLQPGAPCPTPRHGPWF